MAFLLKSRKEFCVLSDGSAFFKVKNITKSVQTGLLLKKDIRNNFRYLDKKKLAKKKSSKKKENKNYRNPFLL